MQPVDRDLVVWAMGASDSKPGGSAQTSKRDPELKRKQNEAAAGAKVDAIAKELEQAQKAAAMQDIIAQQHLELLKAEMRLNEQLAEIDDEEAAAMQHEVEVQAAGGGDVSAQAADGADDGELIGELDEEERAALEAELEELEKAERGSSEG